MNKAFNFALIVFLTGVKTATLGHYAGDWILAYFVSFLVAAVVGIAIEIEESP